MVAKQRIVKLNVLYQRKSQVTSRFNAHQSEESA